MTHDIHLTPRLYIEADLTKGTKLTLGPEPSHYLLNVMRLEDKDSVRVFNARDGEWRGTVTSAGTNKKRHAEVIIAEQLRLPQQEPDLWLCCAPIKRAHFDFVIAKACELGVARIQPILTARTQIRDVNVERCRSIIIEAAEQSERLCLPDIAQPIALERLIETWPEGRLPIVCAESGEALPLAAALRRPEVEKAKSVAIIVGPEGGFSPEEFSRLRQWPQAITVRLGPRILRADTAALAALSCWQAINGDWRRHEG